MTFKELVAAAAAAVGRSPRLVPVPLRPVVAAVRLYERLASAPRVTAEQLQRLAEDKAFDISAAQRDLDYRPRSFSSGMIEQASLMGLALPRGSASARLDGGGARIGSCEMQLRNSKEQR